MPIRKGEQTARVTLDLGDVVVTREWARKDSPDGANSAEHVPPTTTRIRVENADGARFPSPQKMLDGLLGSLTFDPLAFSRASDREQVEMLSGLCGVDMEEVEKAHKADFDERRDWNRSAKSLRSAAEQIDVPDGTPDEAVSVADILGRLRSAEAANREREGARRELEQEERHAKRLIDGADEDMRSAAERCSEMVKQADTLQKQATEMRDRAAAAARVADERASQARQRGEKLQSDLAAVSPVEPDTDTSALQAEASEAELRNADVAQGQRKRAGLLEAAGAEKSAKALTAKMEKRRADTRDAIAKAKLPVDGLAVADGRVMLGDLPFEVASDAERLRVSCAIAMRGDAKLRVLRVRDGSRLDPDSLELLRATAEAADYQVWVEMVDVSGKVGVVIEDGRVRRG